MNPGVGEDNYAEETESVSVNVVKKSAENGANKSAAGLIALTDNIVNNNPCNSYEDIAKYLSLLLNKSYEEAMKTVIDPLIFDLNGDGFDITPKAGGTYFDIDCNGFAEKINWTNTDAILAIDLNENGIVDDGTEVFGDRHLMTDGAIPGSEEWEQVWEELPRAGYGSGSGASASSSKGRKSVSGDYRRILLLYAWKYGRFLVQFIGARRAGDRWKWCGYDFV